MKEYDFIFSLGYCCTCSDALRAEGLQSMSLPLDWVGVSSLRQVVDIVCDGFRQWFDRDLLELWDVRITGGFVTRVYRNRKTGIGFVHEFSNAEPIETAYEAVRERYTRRIERFETCMKSARNVLAVYLESPRNGRLPDAELVRARTDLAAAYPQAEVELLYMYEDPAATAWERVSSPAGVSVVRMDYRVFDGEVLMHLCRHEPVRACLHALVRGTRSESEAERAAFERRKRQQLKRALGKNRFEQWVNKKLRQAFRNLESYLEHQRLIPGDRPLWFDGDGK